MTSNYFDIYLSEVKTICDLLDREQINSFANILKNTTGRCFVVGLGGSAANSTHLVNDLRKLCRIESYSPLDNVSELTARINDDSWESSIKDCLTVSNINEDDCLLVLSVGGGSETTSQPLVQSMRFAKEQGCKVISIVSRNGGEAKTLSDSYILIPMIHENRITPHAEEFQGVLWHMIVNAITDGEIND